MPSYFDDVIPVARRSEKDIRIHRNIRRKVGSDFLSMELVSSYEPHQQCYSWDLTSEWRLRRSLSREGLIRHGIPYAYVNAYPFNIRDFDIRLSLKKKKRWMIGEALENNIWKYQDADNKLRVSFIRAQMSHVKKKVHRWGEIKEVMPKKDVEVITTSASGTKHWQNVCTNHADLLRKPMPPKRIRGRSNTDYVELLKDSAFDEQCLHIVYTETTHKMSKKESSKMGGSERYEKKKARHGFIAPNANVRTMSTKDCLSEYNETMKFIDDRPVEENCVGGEGRPCVELRLIDFVIERRMKKDRRRRVKAVPCCAESIYQPSKASFKDEDCNSDIPISFDPDVHEISSESTAQHSQNYDPFSYPNPLPSYAFFLEDHAEYDQLVIYLTTYAKRIERFSPETFLYTSSENCPLQWNQFEDFSGYVCFRFETEGSASTTLRTAVRLTFNSMDINLPRNLEVPRRFVAAVDLRPILPADWFCSGDCYDQINYQKTVVDSWLRLRNMESAASEKDSQSFFCDVCDSENKDGFSLVCGHFYCNQCWLKHSVEQIKNGKAPITCMNTKCERVLELDHTLTFLPYELCLRYEKLVWEKIMMQKDWLYCESCQSVLHRNVDGEKKRRKLFHPAIVCKCGHSHCILCKRSWHWPLSCNVAERYNDVLENYGEGTSQALQRIKINMRKCPFCRTFCERSYGCNHMSCRCGHDFCYSCGGSWDNDHYNCDLEKNTNLVPLYMVDLLSRPSEDVLHEFVTQNWELRDLKTQTQRRKLRRDTDWMRNEADATAAAYSTAQHVVELCEVALFLLKSKMDENSDVDGTMSISSSKFTVFRSKFQSDFLASLTKRIRFVLVRLNSVMYDSKKISRVIFLRDLLVRTIRHFLSPYYMIRE